MKRPLLAALMALVASAAIAGAVLWQSSATKSVEGPATGPYRGSQPQATIRLPSFALREWDGRLVRSSELRGRVVIVTFLETKCREACPVIADQIGVGLRDLAASERASTYALAISTHPADDRPRSVHAFLRRHRVRGDLHYLIGSERQLRPVWRAFHVLSALDSGHADTHSASVRIFDRRGRWVSTLHPAVDLTPANLVHDLRVAIKRSS